MIKVMTELPDVYESITRPVALQVSRALLRALELPDTIQVLFPGGTEEALQPGSQANFKGEVSGFGSDSRLKIELTENTIEDRVLNTATLQKENVVVFYDPELDVRVWPVYSGTELQFQFEFRAPNRVLAKRFRDEITTRSAMLRRELMFEFNYRYLFPRQFLKLLHHVYTLRENVAGYGDTYNEWMSNHLSLKATNVASADGRNVELAIAETQTTVPGFFDFAAIVEPEQKDKETGTWTVTFNYSVTFDKIIAIAMQYPLSVHNQLIDFDYQASPIVHGFATDPYKGRRIPSSSRNDFDKLSVLYDGSLLEREPVITVPENDPWRPKFVPPATKDVLLALLQITPEDRRTLVNLDELGEYGFESPILEYVKASYRGLTRYGHSMFHVELFEGQTSIHHSKVEIDSDLNFFSKEDLDLRKVYHLRISVITDLFVLTPDARELLRQYGCAALKILGNLQLSIHGRVLDTPLMNGCLLPRREFDQIADFLRDKLYIAGHNYPHLLNVRYVHNTVGNYTIVAQRRGNYHGIDVGQKARDAAAKRAAETERATGANAGTTLPECNC